MPSLRPTWSAPALTIAAIYKNRWQIELFFKWLKQNLAVKHFFGNSINAVKAQIWIAPYLLVLIAIKHHRLPVSPQIFLHLIETNIFEKITLDQLVANAVLERMQTGHEQAIDCGYEIYRTVVIDVSKCVGCKTCQVACKDKNNLEVGRNFRHVVEYAGGDWKSHGARGRMFLPITFRWPATIAQNRPVPKVCLKDRCCR